MSLLLRSLLETSGTALPWIAVAVLGFVGTLLAYLGVAMSVALFHRDPRCRRRGQEVFRDLLSLFARRRK